MSQEEINANKQETKEAVRRSEDRINYQSRDNAQTLHDLEATWRENEANAREARRPNKQASRAEKAIEKLNCNW